MIKVTNLVKKYGDVEALKGVDFEVETGSFVSLLGENGAGKSTTINILSTILSHSEGTIHYDELQIGIDDQEIRSKIGIVFQGSLLDGNLTVRENLNTRGSFYKMSKIDLKNKINQLVIDIELEEFIDRKYKTLSGGQKRRSDIARALINNPEILFMDEPTTGLDPHSRRSVWQIIAKLREEGLTVLLTTHYMDETLDSNKIIIMDKGEIVAEGTPEELRFKYTHDSIKLIPKEGKTNDLEKSLKELKLKYKIDRDIYIVPIDNCFASLDIVSSIKNSIEVFEVIRGNMDDVFLNITGRKLGE